MLVILEFLKTHPNCNLSYYEDKWRIDAYGCTYYFAIGATIPELIDDLFSYLKSDGKNEEVERLKKLLN